MINEKAVETLREETPGCHNRIHFNNAGSSLPPEPVIQTQLRYLLEESLVGGYELANECHNELEEVYQSLARLIHAKPEEIAVMENATDAWHKVFHALPLQEGDQIITTHIEYASNYLSYLQKQKSVGIEIVVIPPDGDGNMDLNKLEDAITGKTALISISHIPTNSGSVNPAEKVGYIANRHDIPYLLDACQSVGQYPIDVDAIGCDMLSATGRKYLRAPRGSGFLYVRENMLDRLDPPFIDLYSATWTSKDSYILRDNTRRFENWESNMGVRLALGRAAEYAGNIGISLIWERVQELARELRSQLRSIHGIKLQDRGTVKSGIVTFTHDRIPADNIQSLLQKQSINISVTTLESTRIDMEQKQLKSAARASVHYYNTQDEISEFVKTLETIVEN